MSNISNLRIQTELGELVYKQASDLNLTFNRIVDDFTDISNRFGDFSYEFNLPIVKENSKIFGAPEAIGSKNFFPKNRNIRCQVYNNQELLLDGLINLESIGQNEYICKFFSKFKELIDTLNEKTDEGTDKTLKTLNLPVVEDWNYEASIIEHIEEDYADSDDTYYQYPISFYSTFFCGTDIYSGLTDFNGNVFREDTDLQNYSYLINRTADDNNRMYHHQIPPAVYIVSIVEQILEDAGWSLGGQFFNQPDIKKIIMLYNGGSDPYDQATGEISGSTPVDLSIATFLPDMSQTEFLKGIINMFNLYFLVDSANKIVQFETYDTFFRASVEIDPYDITTKVDDSGGNTITSYFVNNNPTISFKESGNQNVFGSNKVMSGRQTTQLNKFGQVYHLPLSIRRSIGLVIQKHLDLNKET